MSNEMSNVLLGNVPMMPVMVGNQGIMDKIGSADDTTNTTVMGKLNSVMNGGRGFYAETLVIKGGLMDTLPYEFYNNPAVVYNNEIHILGGSNTPRYHYKWNGSSWTEVSSLPYDFYRGWAVVYNNEIHILGSNQSGSEAWTNHYKWNGSSWVSVSTLPYKFFASMAVVYNNEIHILGGSSFPYNHYAWNGSSWREVSTLPYIFSEGSAVVYNNEIHILGTISTTDTRTEHYAWNGSSWREVSTLPCIFYRGSAVVYNNEIHILGSAEDNGCHYKWNGSSWREDDRTPYNFYEGCAVVYDVGIHALGGWETGFRAYHYIFNNSLVIFLLKDTLIYSDNIAEGANIEQVSDNCWRVVETGRVSIAFYGYPLYTLV